jgi:hypothetical protein
MYKKILSLVLTLVIVLSLAGCQFAASMATKTINVNTGDTLKFSFKTDKHMWDSELADGLLTMEEDDEIIFKCAFHDEDTMEDYVEVVNGALESGAQDIEVEDDGKINNIKYVLISFDQDDERVYEFIGWIVGSNTGIVADVYGDEDFAEEVLETIKFTVKKTEQDDESYYCDVIKDIDD